MSKEVKEFFSTYSDFVTKVTSEPIETTLTTPAAAFPHAVPGSVGAWL